MLDVIIIGGGVAGLMCANKLKVKNALIIEKNNSCGRKLLMTGNGRCNLTNLKSNSDFLNNVKHNKKYLYSTINLFGPKEIYDYFYKVGLKEEVDNRIFPKSNKASDILNFLLSKNKYPINYNETLMQLDISDNIKVITNKNTYITKNVVIATGGASYKVTGSTGDIINICKNIDQDYIDLYPVESSIILKEPKTELSGTSFDDVYLHNFKTRGKLLFTHKGLSGELIMNASEDFYLKKIKEIYIDFLPDLEKEQIIFDRDKLLSTNLNKYFTKKFSDYLITTSNLKNDLVKRLNVNNLLENIKRHKFNILRVNDIDYAYATGGGVNLNSINTKSFESKINKGVYFIGECLDIHGIVGGYNITMALSTAYSCAIDINKKE